MTPPIHSVKPEDWSIYRDWCIDHDFPRVYVDRIFLIADALKFQPKLGLRVVSRVDRGEVWMMPFSKSAKKSQWAGFAGNDLASWVPSHWRRAEGAALELASDPTGFPGLIEHFPLVAWEFFLEITKEITKESDLEMIFKGGAA